jgi:SNF2 family DNA or RNA helicase
MVEVSDFHQKVLRRAASPEMKLYHAGLEWDLTDPIVIETPEDFKSTPRWKDRFTPFQHQVANLITFCRRLPVTLLADDVGLGKTISAGLVISELASRSRISKILVICPKILGPQWSAELTTKFDIPSKFVTGQELIAADFEEFGAIITTYNSARLYLDRIPDDRFQMLVLDEAHKLRNLYGVEKTPQVANCFHKALNDRRFRFVLMLTATPIHNRLWDIYSLVDLLTVARGHHYPVLEGALARKVDGAHCRILSGAISTTGNALAICAESKAFLGLKISYLGCVFSPRQREIVGRVTRGKRSKNVWIPD